MHDISRSQVPIVIVQDLYDKEKIRCLKYVSDKKS